MIRTVFWVGEGSFTFLEADGIYRWDGLEAQGCFQSHLCLLVGEHSDWWASMPYQLLNIFYITLCMSTLLEGKWKGGGDGNQFQLKT